MITRIARIEAETDIASLARALYRVVRGRGGESLMRRAEAALLAANPSLRDERVLVPGRRVVVPQVEGLTLTTRVTDDGEAIGDPAAEALGRLSRIAETLERGVETAKLRRDHLIEQASGEDIREIVEKELRDESALLDRAVAATKREQELEETRLNSLRTALDAARAAFDAIAQRGSTGPGGPADVTRPGDLSTSRSAPSSGPPRS